MSARRRRATLAANITLAADNVPEQVLLEALEPLAGRLKIRGAAVSMDLQPSRLIVDLDVTADSPDPSQALPDVQTALTDVITAVDDVLGPNHGCTTAAVTVQTAEQRDLALAKRDLERDLVGVAEIAELRGVARQSASRTAQMDRFPRPFARLASGPVWIRAEVLQFFAREDARRGTGEQPAADTSTTTATPPGTTPNLEFRTRLAGLLTHATGLPDDVDAAAGRPHLLTGTTLAHAIEALGGTAAVASQMDVTPRTVQRWVAGAAPTRSGSR